jgi:hypothetical protein
MSGHTHRKKDGHRTEHQTRRRQSELEQPVAHAVAPERASDVSNFTDGDIAGADHKHEPNGQLKYKSPASEPRPRGARER